MWRCFSRALSFFLNKVESGDVEVLFYSRFSKSSKFYLFFISVRLFYSVFFLCYNKMEFPIYFSMQILC
jgi:hypothetical protein